MITTDLIKWLEGVAQYSPDKEVKYEGRAGGTIALMIEDDEDEGDDFQSEAIEIK